MRVVFVRTSQNRKTGPIPISVSPKVTCPPSGPLQRSGCYAESGPLGWHWDRLSNGEVGIGWGEFLEAVRRLPTGALWRHNVAGDLPGHGEKINISMLAELVKANRGKQGFTYTHKHASPENLATIRDASRQGFTINLSANTLTEADELAGKRRRTFTSVVQTLLVRDIPIDRDEGVEFSCHRIERPLVELRQPQLARRKSFSTSGGSGRRPR